MIIFTFSQWIEFCNALYVEAKWYKTGYIPSLQEYLNNAWITSSGPLILLHSYFATVYELTNEIDDFPDIYDDLVYNVSLIIRLCNDLGTAVVTLLFHRINYIFVFYLYFSLNFLKKEKR